MLVNKVRESDDVQDREIRGDQEGDVDAVVDAVALNEIELKGCRVCDSVNVGDCVGRIIV